MLVVLLVHVVFLTYDVLYTWYLGWWFFNLVVGDFWFNPLTCCAQLMCIMSTRQGLYTQYCPDRQTEYPSICFWLQFSKLNFCQMYRIYSIWFCILLIYTLSFTENGSGNGKLTESRSALLFVWIIAVGKHVVLFVFIYSMMFLLYRLHGYERNQWGLMEPAERLRLIELVGKPALSLFVDFTMFLWYKVIKRNSLV